jgi:hypothetical protein
MRWIYVVEERELGKRASAESAIYGWMKIETYQQLTASGVLNTGDEKLNVTLRHNGTIGGGNRAL